MTEDQLEQNTLGWLGKLGYKQPYGPDIATTQHRGTPLPRLIPLKLDLPETERLLEEAL